MDANDNKFSFPANVEADEALTIIQSDEILGAKIALLPKASRQLFNYYLYYCGKVTSDFIASYGIDVWNKIKSEVIDYDVDLQPLFDLPAIQEAYGKRGVHKVFTDAAEALVETSLTLVSPDETEKTITACISSIKMDLIAKNRCKVSLNRDILSLVVSELIEQNDMNETHKLSIVQTFGFKSKYAEKLYILINGKIQATEYLSMSQPFVRCSIIFLKKLFGLDGNKTYSSNSKFNERILYPALEELNNISDLEASCRPVRDGRYIRFVEFYNIKRKGSSDVVVELDAVHDDNEVDITKKQEEMSDGMPGADKRFFVNEAEKDGFSTTQILDLYMHYNGDADKLIKARKAYEAVCEIGIVPAGDKFNFFMTLT